MHPPLFSDQRCPLPFHLDFPRQDLLTRGGPEKSTAPSPSILSLLPVDFLTQHVIFFFDFPIAILPPLPLFDSESTRLQGPGLYCFFRLPPPLNISVVNMEKSFPFSFPLPFVPAPAPAATCGSKFPLSAASSTLSFPECTFFFFFLFVAATPRRFVSLLEFFPFISRTCLWCYLPSQPADGYLR